MKTARIAYTKPSITDLEVAYVNDAVRNGWGEHCYDYIKRFEADFASKIGSGYAIATSSCTGALHMGLAALGVGPGDEVILADINWVASVAPIVHLGAKPVFVDICYDSWCLDVKEVAQAITPRTKAIIAVHLYGNLCDMDALAKLALEHGLALIEDAAEALGSRWRGKAAGSIGCFGVFSFHGTKTMTTGEGGMFVTSDQALYDRVLTLSNHGRAVGQTRQFWPDLIGFKYKMSNLQAAMGCAQLERLDDLVARKREIFDYYAAALAGYRGIFMNPQEAETFNSYWMPTIVLSPEWGIGQEQLLAGFAAQGVDARVFFSPLSSLPMFQRERTNRLSYDIHARAINLPSYHDMTFHDQDRVLEVLFSILDGTAGAQLWKKSCF